MNWDKEDTKRIWMILAGVAAAIVIIITLAARAFATGLPAQTIAAAEQSITEMLMVLVGIVVISYIFSYVITELGKHWRKDHGVKRLSFSSSVVRSTLLAFVAFVALWYVAHSFGFIVEHSWPAAIIFGCIISPIAPWAWNPMIAATAKISDGVRDAIKRDREIDRESEE